MTDVARGDWLERVLIRRWWLAWGAVVLAWFVIVYGGCNWLTAQRSARVRLHLDAELNIPLVPATVWVYLSLNPFMWLSGWVLDRPAQWRALAATMIVAIGIAGLGFLAFPAEVGYEPWHDTVPVAWHGIFEFTAQLVGAYNLFPSLHVALAWISAIAYERSALWRWWPLWYAWAAAITVATLLTHQHHLIDLVGGMGLAWLCTQTVHRRMLPERSPSDPASQPPETTDRTQRA